MAVIRPFRALRPTVKSAADVASVPYDVVSTDEARRLAFENSLSFLHVSRAEVGLPAGTHPYSAEVYERASLNLTRLQTAAPLVVDEKPSLYLYGLRTDQHEQIGLAGCFSLDEYDVGIVKRHERTRPDKEDDRTNHMVAVGAQTGIVFLTYRSDAVVDAVIERCSDQDPLLDIVATDEVRHTIWRLSADDAGDAVRSFARVRAVYIADGHHRIASAARARQELPSSDPEAEAHFFLGVAFPDVQTRILPYNRTVADLAGQTPEAFLDLLRGQFPVKRSDTSVPAKGSVAMYLRGRWWSIDFSLVRERMTSGSPVSKLDVAVLQDHLMAPLLSIADIRTDHRVTFIGGGRGTDALVQSVDSGEAAVAFSLAAVTPTELLDISDAGEMMPPKSTWFEPKLRDGLLIHPLQS